VQYSNNNISNIKTEDKGTLFKRHKKHLNQVCQLMVYLPLKVPSSLQN